MNQLTVKCPQCQCEVSIDDALAHQLQEAVKKETSQELEAEKKALRAQMMEWQEQEKKKLESLIDQESKALKAELQEKEQKLKEAQELELKLRQDKNNLEKAKAEFELEKARQLDEEREKIKAETGKLLLDQYQLKDKEKDKQLEDMRRKIEELQLKAHLGSQQLQGEILELEIEEKLRSEFPSDEIVEVAKGVRGADIVQHVYDLNSGVEAGVIVWESKRTYKNWDKAWVSKLKEDAIKVKADAAVIVSNVLPESIKSFALQEGILICSFECLTYIAQLLREQIIRYKHLETSNTGKDARMEGLYNYLRSNQFKHHVESIADAWTSMRKQVDDERKVFERQWAAREKALERVMTNTMGMYGDIQGLMGSSAPELDGFGVTSLLDSPDEELVN